MENKVKCILCEQPIQNYDSVFNHLTIDESHAADICTQCIDRFLRWQQSIYARFFPTNAVKKRYGRG